MSLKTPINIEPNRNYEISGWMRAEGEHTSFTDSVWLMVCQNNQTIAIADMGIRSTGGGEHPTIPDTGWIFKSKIFSTDASSPITVKILMPFENVWIDELKLAPM